MSNLTMIILLATAFSIPSGLVLADQEPEFGTVTSMDASFRQGKSTADAVGLAAEYELKNEHYDKAIKLFRKSLEQDSNDADLHLGFAQALEGKLKSSDERDPYVYNECIKEWLNIFRSESGDEKGLSFHGIALPGMTYYYQDEERTIVGRNHLVSLTGRAPKPWETNAKYLKKVLSPTSETVQGKVVKPKSDD